MFKKILYSFSVYTLTSVICAVLSVFILPVLTKYLSEKDYGATALFSTYVMILSPIIGLSSGGYFWLEFFKKQKERSQQNSLFSTYFWLTCFFTMAVTLLLLVFYPLFSGISFFSLFFILLIPEFKAIGLLCTLFAMPNFQSQKAWILKTGS